MNIDRTILSLAGLILILIICLYAILNINNLTIDDETGLIEGTNLSEHQKELVNGIAINDERIQSTMKNYDGYRIAGYVVRPCVDTASVDKTKLCQSVRIHYIKNGREIYGEMVTVDLKVKKVTGISISPPFPILVSPDT